MHWDILHFYNIHHIETFCILIKFLRNMLRYSKEFPLAVGTDWNIEAVYRGHLPSLGAVRYRCPLAVHWLYSTIQYSIVQVQYSTVLILVSAVHCLSPDPLWGQDDKSLHCPAPSPASARILSIREAVSECLSNVNSVAQLFSDEYHRKQKLVQCLCMLVILYPWSVTPFLLYIFCRNCGTDRQWDPTSFFRSGHFFSVKLLGQGLGIGHTYSVSCLIASVFYYISLEVSASINDVILTTCCMIAPSP